MIDYKDFAPQQLEPPGLLSGGKYESFDAALAAANKWIQTKQVKVLNVETVVLPNMWREEGTTDVKLSVHGETRASWHQFIRVWYELPSS
jgi:hypothetical protein